MSWLLFFFCGLLAAEPALGVRPVETLLQQNRLQEAMPYCRQIEVLSSYSQSDLVSCAWVFYRLGKLDAAEVIKSKLKASSSSEFQLLTAYAHLKKERFDQARMILEDLEVKFKGSAFGLTVREVKAEMYELKGNIAAAAFIYRDIVSSDPRRARAHWGLARHYLNKGEQERAIIHLKDTAKLWPKHIASRYNLGVLLISQESYKQAGKWLAECYKINRADSGVLEQLGILFEKKGKFSDAVRYWQRAYDLDKEKSSLAKRKLSKYYVKLIDQSIKSKRWTAALKYLRSAEKVDVARKRRLLCRRGVVLRNLSSKKTDFAKAAGELRACLSAFPKDAQALRELGITYVNLNILQDARSFFLRATKVEPKNGMNHAWLGYAQSRLRQVCEARKSWRKAISLLSDPEEISKATRSLASVEEAARGKCGK